jgi:primosomal protein N' (replication factor Y)
MIEVGKSLLPGIVLREVSPPVYTTKIISSLLYDQPLPPQLVALADWTSRYYKTHLATVLQTFLPTGLQKKRRPRLAQDAAPQLRDRTKNVFTPAQASAIATIEAMTPGTALLHGVTGAGKTLIYIELARQSIETGKSVMILVPEIALTPQIVDEFTQHFDNVLLAHSRQTEAERHAVWQSVLQSDRPQIIIGPRSALFLPARAIGLVVVDEAHEPSFKQEQSPRYSALRAASILVSSHNAKLIIGSATPSVADYYLASQTNRPLITIKTRARSNALPPTIDLIDMTKKQNFKSHRFLSNKILAQLSQVLADKGQALIFHNRRGSTSTTVCEQCGWSAICKTCFIPMTLHADSHQLRCHICGQQERVPTHCPDCGASDILHKGIGTKLIQAELQKQFPHARIARFDADNDPDETLEMRYKDLYEGNIDLIIGTQIVAKGLDLPKLRMVGVIQADAGLSLPDFSASERTFQLLAQVVGRVGRSHLPTSVVVQTFQPTHAAIVDGLAQDYDHFYQATLAERRRAHFPPFSFLLKLTCTYKTEDAAIKNAQKVADIMRDKVRQGTQILGPAPAFYERQRDTYRWQLVIKSQSRAELAALLDHLPAAHWQAELDPTSLL